MNSSSELELVVQYSSGTAWTSEIIRRICHSPFSHVDIVMPDGTLLGASGPDKTAKAIVNGVIVPDPGGVQIRPYTPWPYAEEAKRARIKTPKVYDILAQATSQIGKPFDDEALHAMLGSGSGARDWREQDKWFCSELVTWVCESMGMFPYPLAVRRDRVSPAETLLLFNPFMSADNVHEFSGALATGQG